MKLNEIKTNENQAVLAEASIKKSFLLTWALTTSFGGAFAIAAVTVAPFAGSLMGIGLALTSLIQFSIGGIWLGLLVSLFARGAQRDLYKKMKRKTKSLLKYINKMDRKLDSASTDEEADAIRQEAEAVVLEELQEIESIQTKLDRMLRRDIGDSGIFRSSFRRHLTKQLEKGVDLRRVMKQIDEKGEEMAIDIKAHTDLDFEERVEKTY